MYWIIYRTTFGKKGRAVMYRARKDNDAAAKADIGSQQSTQHAWQRQKKGNLDALTKVIGTQR
jgi:hypothetical protein